MQLLNFIEKIPDYLIPKLKTKNYFLYVVWREICHSIGSVFLLYFSYVIQSVSNLPIIFIVFTLLTIWMTYQEFYLHPKKYKQKLWKGILDWLSWIIPFAVFFIFF